MHFHWLTMFYKTGHKYQRRKFITEVEFIIAITSNLDTL